VAGRDLSTDERGSYGMLAVTDNAATAIRDITSQEAVPPGAGLRIATDETGASLTLSLVAEPFEGDQVVDASGARLFLDADAALLLDDKELDVTVDPSGDVQFAVADQLDFGMSEEY
jgi:iron-sulfur cluster assembly protein